MPPRMAFFSSRRPGTRVSAARAQWGAPTSSRSARTGPIGLFAVGASTATGAPAFFSNNGSWLSLLAPGENLVGPLAPVGGIRPRERSEGRAAGIGQRQLRDQQRHLLRRTRGDRRGSTRLGGEPAAQRDPGCRDHQAHRIGRGAWNVENGFGVLDVAAAIETAARTPTDAPHLQDVEELRRHARPCAGRGVPPPGD